MTIPFKKIDNKNEKAVLFVHGFMGNQNSWDLLHEHLPDSFNYYFIDTPGHGDFFINSDFQRNDFFHALDNFLKTHSDIKKLVGYSQGGRLLLEYASKYEKDYQYYIESSHPGLLSEVEKEQRYLSDINLLKEIKSQDDLDRFIENWYSAPLFQGIKEIEEYAQISRKNIKEVSQWLRSLELYSLGKQDYLLPLKSDLNIYYFYGNKDKKYSEIAKEFKAYKLQEMDGSHNTHIMDPRGYISKILD